MKTIVLKEYLGIKKTEIKLFESIHDLPAKLYNQFNKYMLQEQYIGSTMKDVDAHFGKFDLWIKQKKYDKLSLERVNLHLNFFAAMNAFNFKHIAFGCFIYSIGGKKIEDHSEENLRLLIDNLSDKGLTQKMVSDIIAEVKKNLILN